MISSRLRCCFGPNGAGDPAANPSDDLMVLNGIYDGEIQRFEQVSRENRLDTTWSLYRVR